MLQYHFNWKTLSAMAGVTWWNFYFRLFPGSIRSPQVVQFLQHLLRHLDCKLLVVWDGSRTHRSRLIWDFVREQKGRLWLEFLPAYAPELNPVEYLWSHWKQHELPNFCPQTFWQLSHYGNRLLGSGGTVLTSLYYAILNSLRRILLSLKLLYGCRAQIEYATKWPNLP